MSRKDLYSLGALKSHKTESTLTTNMSLAYNYYKFHARLRIPRWFPRYFIRSANVGSSRSPDDRRCFLRIRRFNREKDHMARVLGTLSYGRHRNAIGMREASAMLRIPLAHRDARARDIAPGGSRRAAAPWTMSPWPRRLSRESLEDPR